MSKRKILLTVLLAALALLLMISPASARLEPNTGAEAPVAASVPEDQSGSGGVSAQGACWSPCTAKEVNSIRFWVGTCTSQAPLEPCSIPDPVQACIYAEITTNAASDRYAPLAKFDLWVNDAFVGSYMNCVTGQGGKLLHGTATYKVHENLTWKCGDKVELRNLCIGWSVDASDTCPSYNCPQPGSKCQCMTGSYPVSTPLSVGASATNVCLGTATQFTADVHSGTAPYTYAWTFGDGGTSTIANPTHTYAATGTYNVSLTVTDSASPAKSQTVSTTATVYPGVAVNVTADATELNCTNPDALLTANVTSGKAPFHYAWYKGTTQVGGDSSTYTATAAGEYKVVVTDANGCSSGSNTVTVTFVPSLAVSVLPTGGQLTCNVPSITLNATASGGTAPIHYKWYKDNVEIPSSDSASYTATAAGTYKVVATDANSCTATSNEVVITSAPAPTVSISTPNAALTCNNASALLTAVVTNGVAPVHYAWYKGTALVGSDASTFTATEAGDYKVVVTDGNTCSATSNVITVTVAPAPTVSISAPSTQLRCNQPVVLLTASVTNGVAPIHYAWYKGTTLVGTDAPTFSAEEAGTYKVVITDGNGCTATSNLISVTIVPGPIVWITAPDTVLRCNHPCALLTAEALAECPAHYTWYRGTTVVGTDSPTYLACEPGTYTVVITDVNTCQATSTPVTVTRLPDPTVTISTPNAELNCANSSALLTASVTNGVAPIHYAWFKGTTPVGTDAPTYTATEAGLYKVVITDANTCAATSNVIEITRVPDPTVSVSAGGELNCNVRMITLDATVTGGEGPFTYTWYKDGNAIAGASGSSYNATEAGSYTVSIVDMNGCTAASSPAVVTSVPSVTVNLTVDGAELNCNHTLAMLNAAVSGGKGPFTYAWYLNGTLLPALTGNTVYTNVTGVWKVIVTDASGCTGTSNEITITSVPNPSVSITADDAELNCKNSDTMLTATVNGGEAPFGYQWFKDGSAIQGANQSTYTATAAGVYKVVVTDNNGCTAASNEITVTQVPNPAVDITSVKVNQCTASAEFTATATSGEAPYTFAWDLDGDGQYDDATGATVSYTFPDDGTYTVKVQVTDNNGCTATAETSVTIKVPDPNVDITKTVDKTIIHAGDPVHYTYVVTNTGVCPLLNVTLTDDKLGTIVLTGLTDQDGDNVADDMAPGGSASGAASANLTVDTVNVATVTGTNFRGKVFTDQAEVKVIIIHPAIDLVKDGPKYAYEGEKITYVFTVTNTSPDTVLNNVTVSDPMLGGVIWGPQTLAIGQSVKFTVDYTIPAGSPNPLKNTATTQGTDILGWTVTDTDDHSLYILRPLGFKFNDTEGDGVYQSYQDPLLGGWQIRLLNESTKQAWTVTTATGGQFFGKWFAPKNLPAGKYWIEEIQQGGWNQTYPGQASPANAYEIEYHEDGSYTLLSARPNQFNGLSFGNTQGLGAGSCDCVDWLVFDSNRDGNWELYGTSADGSNLVRLTNSPAVDMAPTIRNASSVDRTLVAFQSDRDGKWNIYTVDTMGGSLKRLTWQGNNTDPVWSTECNSHYLAFVSDRDGNQEIYVMNADGNSQVRLTNDGGADTDPSWGPNAGSLVFQSNRTGKWQLYRIDRTGANLKRLTNDNANDVDPAWSPDGKWIAFRSDRDGQWNTYIMPAAGGEAIRLSAGGDNVGAVWSPDSGKLAYQSSRDGKWQVYVVDVNSKAESRVVTDTANDEWATWNCTSDGLVFQTDRSGNWELVYYGLDGQQRAQTTDNPGADVYPAWNPAEEDGSLFGMDVMVPAPAAAAVTGGIKPAKPKATPVPQSKWDALK